MPKLGLTVVEFLGIGASTKKGYQSANGGRHCPSNGIGLKKCIREMHRVQDVDVRN